jgi:3-oxoacyl-[acyl-carrier protein] reductase
MDKKLNGKVAVVTGASKGIGASIAETLANEGASVIVNYSTSKEGAQKVVDKITKNGGKAVAIQANIANPKEIEKLFSESKNAFGKIDILVNNAGVYETSPIEKITLDHFHKIFDLNVLGLLLSIKEAVKHFGDSGSIINISSIASSSAPPGFTVYSASKAAVDTITKSLAKELGPKKIRVNSINPGMVVTEGTLSGGFIESDFRKHAEAGTPLGRIGQPRDIAPAVVFLASDEASWITGETLVIAGGYR